MSGLRKTRGEGYEISDRLFLLYWHFWIGLLITPVLLLMCITGGILLFEDELLLRVYPTELSDSQWQEGQFDRRLSQDYYDKILPMVQEKLEPDQVVWRVELEHRKGRFPSVLVAPKNKPWPQQRYYVNTNTQELYPSPESRQDANAVDQTDNDLFKSTTLFHRTLYMGWFGRLLVEFTATWLIATTLLGVLLWFRNKASKSGKRASTQSASMYLALRRFHSTAGLVSAIAIVTIAWNGLHYSELYGTLYHGIARATGQYDYLLDVPKGKQAGATDLTPLELGQALRAAREHGLSWQRISVQRLAASSGTLMIESGGDYPPSMTQTLYLDAHDHELLARYDYGDLGWQARWNKWSYSLHTGSFGGLATKILWMIVLVLIALLPISACAMTLARRRKQLLASDQTVSMIKLLPKRALPKTRWIWFALGVVGVLFPLIGLLAFAIASASWLLAPRRSSSRIKQQHLS
jgi:uncharacterized iron-regulated membrane protein